MVIARFGSAAGLTLAALCILIPAWAGGSVKVIDPWARATVPGQMVAGAYMELVSEGDAAVISAASPVAGVVQIHTMKMEGDMMRMRAVDRIELPAGQPVKLAPGGYHVMLMDLKRQLKPGDSVPITLTIEGRDRRRTTLEIAAPVREGPKPHRHGQ